MKHAIVYLLCGLPGSGKTTYAKKIVDEQGALSLSIDDEMIKRYGVAGIDYPTEKSNEYKT